MKKNLSLLLALMLAFTLNAAWAQEASPDYTVAEKLLKQLEAGSGFSGTLTLEITDPSAAQEPATQEPAASASKPLNFQWDYVHVRQDGLIEEQQRVDVALMDGETVQSTAHLQWKDQYLSLQADLLGPDWYRASLPASVTAQSGETVPTDTLDGVMSGAMENFFQQEGVSNTLVSFLPIALGCLRQNEVLDKVLERFLTRMDIWIEGYRESTVLGKLEDGTGTMELRYVIAPANVKAQLKQMVLDLLSDASVLSRLEEHFGKEYVSRYLNAEWQPYYFKVIDQLPLTGDLIIERNVSLKGDTLSLALALPYYDSESGDATLRYTRKKGDDDLPNSSLSLESESRVIRLSYLEYSSLSDVTVIQGTFVNEPAGQSASPQTSKPLALAFTLRSQITEGTDQEQRDTYGGSWQLSLAPDQERNPDEIQSFNELEIALDAVFASKIQKKASTQLDAKLVLSGEKQPKTVTLVLSGKTRAGWSPEEVPQTAISLNDMTSADWGTLLTKAGLNGAALLLPYFSSLSK